MSENAKQLNRDLAQLEPAHYRSQTRFKIKDFESLIKNYKIVLKTLHDTTVIEIKRIDDVSPRGLGFISKAFLNPGMRVQLAINDRVFQSEIVYCYSYIGTNDLYRCGLFIREQNVNLTRDLAELFRISKEPRPQK